MQPLVSTPSPNPTESLLGYVLRVSEKNGYETPTHILDYAGITRREALSPFFPIERFSAVLGKEPGHLLSIAYSAKRTAGNLQFRLLGHDLGQSTRARTYRLTKPAFCPRCVAEKGYLEAHWDIELVTACPRHACKLLAACPACGKKVRWHRKGLLRCECGHDWSNTKTSPADPAAVELQAILVSKIQERPIEEPLSAGMPIEHLQGLPLPALLGAVEIVGRAAAKCEKLDDTDRYELVVKAAAVFANWPVNYERLIDAIVADGGVMGLKHFLSALARAGATEEYGCFLRGPVRGRIAALPPFNPRMGHHINKCAQGGADSIRRTKLSGQIRHNSVGERRAAAFLGIPVKALCALRASGHYRVLNVPTPRSAYHVADLQGFQREILESVPILLPTDCMNDDILSLGHVLREIHFGSSAAKAGMVVSIMEGEIVPIGRSGDRIQDVILRKSDVTALWYKTRFRVEGNTFSPAEAATYLHCDPTIFAAMVKEGALQAIQVPAGIRLTERSVKEFGERYVSVTKLAKEIGTSSRRLQKEITKKNVPLKTFKRGYGKAHQPFVSLEYDGLLTEILENLQTVSSASHVRPTSATLMRQYLEELRERKAFLPRRAGKTNRSAIAKACGFDRNILYLNTEVMALLETFEMEDYQI